jgi:translation initiation factor 3 subunit I
MKPLVLKGHSKPIKDLQFNKDNDLLFSASTDRLITLWSSEYGERIGTYLHDAAVYTMSIDDTSKYLVSGDSTGCVYLWEASTGTLINKFLMPKVPSIRSVNFNYQNDLISIAYGGRTATSESVIDIYKFEDLLKKEKKAVPLKTILIPDNDKISKTRWCDLGKVIIVASETGKLYKYDYESKNLLIQKNIHDKLIMDLDISPKEELIMTAGKDGKAKILDPDTFDVMSELFPQNPVRNINACRFSPLISEEDEKKVKYHAFIAGGQESRDVTTTTSKKGGFETLIYDCMFGCELGAILGHFGPVNALAISSDAELLASGSEESSVRVHRINNEEYNNLERK